MYKHHVRVTGSKCSLLSADRSLRALCVAITEEHGGVDWSAGCVGARRCAVGAAGCAAFALLLLLLLRLTRVGTLPATQ